MGGSWDLSIGVCDDQPEDLAVAADMAAEILEAEGIGFSISRFSSGAALLAAAAKTKFDIFLLDVVMEEQNGMELAAALRRLGSDSAIIFVSSNREMAMLGYEVSALRYLGKPLQREKLREALLYCCQRQFGQKEILLPTPEGQRRIPLSEIVYIEPWERGSRLVLTSGSCLTGAKISQLQRLLPQERFCFCHRTILVSLAFIQSLRYCELTLKTGQTLPVSKYRQAQLKESLLNYLRR